MKVNALPPGPVQPTDCATTYILEVVRKERGNSSSPSSPSIDIQIVETGPDLLGLNDAVVLGRAEGGSDD